MSEQHISPFEAIRRVDEDGYEYWSARELGKLLGYGEYRFFKNAIQKAEEACKQSKQAVSDHFVQMHEMIKIGKGARPPDSADLPVAALLRTCNAIVHPPLLDYLNPLASAL